MNSPLYHQKKASITKKGFGVVCIAMLLFACKKEIDKSPSQDNQLLGYWVLDSSKNNTDTSATTYVRMPCDTIFDLRDSSGLISYHWLEITSEGIEKGDCSYSNINNYPVYSSGTSYFDLWHTKNDLLIYNHTYYANDGEDDDTSSYVFIDNTLVLSSNVDGTKDVNIEYYTKR